MSMKRHQNQSSHVRWSHIAPTRSCSEVNRKTVFEWLTWATDGKGNLRGGL